MKRNDFSNHGKCKAEPRHDIVVFFTESQLEKVCHRNDLAGRQGKGGTVSGTAVLAKGIIAEMLAEGKTG